MTFGAGKSVLLIGGVLIYRRCPDIDILLFLSKSHVYTYLSSVLLFKLIKVCPGISEVWVNFDCPLEPLSAFTNLPLQPEQPKNVGGKRLSF